MLTQDHGSESSGSVNIKIDINNKNYSIIEIDNYKYTGVYFIFIKCKDIKFANE